MEKKTKKFESRTSMVFLGSALTATLQHRVNDLMSERMTYVSDLGDTPSDDELNYLATLTDLVSQLRTAVILNERLSYFKTKIQ